MSSLLVRDIVVAVARYSSGDRRSCSDKETETDDHRSRSGFVDLQQAFRLGVVLGIHN
jgi:hypothetical protein